MRTMKLVLVAAAAAMVAPQLGSARPGMRAFAPGDADERVPFIDTDPSDPKHEYPSWLPQVGVMTGAARVGVDDDFVAHVVGVENISSVDQVMYANNRFEDRNTDQSGFSAHFQVSAATATEYLASAPDVAVAPD